MFAEVLEHRSGGCQPLSATSTGRAATGLVKVCKFTTDTEDKLMNRVPLRPALEYNYTSLSVPCERLRLWLMGDYDFQGKWSPPLEEEVRTYSFDSRVLRTHGGGNGGDIDLTRLTASAAPPSENVLRGVRETLLEAVRDELLSRRVKNALRLAVGLGFVRKMVSHLLPLPSNELRATSRAANRRALLEVRDMYE